MSGLFSTLKFIYQFGTKILARITPAFILNWLYWTSNRFILSTSTKLRESNICLSNRGLAVILNHNKFKAGLPARLGTDRDVENLTKVLPNLGFGYLVYDDLTVNEIMDLPQDQLLRLNKDINWDEIDSILIFVLSYGGSNNTTEAFDKSYNVSSLIDEFRSERCPQISGKNKLFFISTCRGENPVPTSSINIDGKYQTDSVTYAFERHLLYNNLVVVYATTENASSVLDPENGTLFIQSFYETANNFGCENKQKRLDIMEFYRIMNNNLVRRTATVNGEKVKQMAQIVSTLRRPYYFKKID